MLHGPAPIVPGSSRVLPHRPGAGIAAPVLNLDPGSTTENADRGNKFKIVGNCQLSHPGPSLVPV